MLKRTSIRKPALPVDLSPFSLNGEQLLKNGRPITGARVHWEGKQWQTRTITRHLQGKITRQVDMHLSPHAAEVVKELYNIMEADGHVQRPIEAMAGISKGCLSRWFNAIHSPRVDIIEAVGQVLGYQLKWEKIQ